jgi:hypothetical protein
VTKKEKGIQKEVGGREVRKEEVEGKKLKIRR